MKKILLSIIALTSFLSISEAQVGDWPYSPTGYTYFGATGLDHTAVGNYALLQAKGSNSNAPGQTYLNSPLRISFRINNADKMTLATNGYVGIGTITPSFLLHVKKDQTAYTYITSDNAGTAGAGTGSGFAVAEAGNVTWYMRGERDGSSRFNIGTSNSNLGNIMTLSPYGSSIMTVKRNQAGYTYINVDNGGTAGSGVGEGFMMTEGTGNLAWYMRAERDGTGTFNIGNPNGSKLTIDTYGNVGIGVPNLKTKNPNGYKLAVNGTIGAKAIRVETTSTTWADYVFEKNYKLKTLEEVEEFINTNKHLPNVPSACEVEEKGIDMATMDATLLAKIEELTLYMIAQNKLIEAQNKRIEAMEAQLK